jgi:hypothetical protein
VKSTSVPSITYTLIDMCLLVRRGLCLLMFGCGNIILLAMRFFDVVKFTVLTPFSLRYFVESHSQMSI